MSKIAAHRHETGLTRRECLRAGAIGWWGISLADLWRMRACAETEGSKKRSLIIAFCPGAPSHIDTWDPKPEAPAQIRGEFRTIAAKTPGVRLSEHLPLLAALSNKYTLIRSMTHGEREHEPGTHTMLCGLHKAPSQSGRANRSADRPNIGSILSYVRPGASDVPSAVVLPTKLTFQGNFFPGQNAGFLGAQYDPWHLDGDPNSAEFRPPDLELPRGLSLRRLDGRRDLLAEIETQRRDLDRSASVARLDGFRRKAASLLSSRKTRDAFDLNREDPRLRDRYGRHMMGQGLLLARRLVEAGVGFVQVNLGVMNHWDTHSDNFGRLKNELLPPYDRGVSALIEDLDRRGLADETILIVTGEFGRTPRVGLQTTVANAAPNGRDHWGGVFSTLVYGGGLKGGQVLGSSDRMGAYPASHPHTPADLAATVFRQLGVEPRQEIRDAFGRPFILNEGTVIDALLA